MVKQTLIFKILLPQFRAGITGKYESYAKKMGGNADNGYNYYCILFLPGTKTERPDRR
jgi:hypothetical protein